MRKELFLGIFILIIILSLCACDKDTSKKEPNEEVKEETREEKLAESIEDILNSDMVDQYENLKSLVVDKYNNEYIDILNNDFLDYEKKDDIEESNYRIDIDDIGTSITWSLSDDMKTLYINGTGVVNPDTVSYDWKTYAEYIEKIVIGEGVTSIEGGYSAVGLPVSILGTNENCKVNEVVLPNSLKSIGKCCFTGTKIETIDIPDSVTYIGERAFDSCHSLVEIHLPKSLKEFGDFAFYECGSLRFLAIPEGVTYIGKALMYDLNNLEVLYIPSTTKQIDSAAAENIYYSGTLKDWIGLGKKDYDNMHYEANYQQVVNMWNNKKYNGIYELYAVNVNGESLNIGGYGGLQQILWNVVPDYNPGVEYTLEISGDSWIWNSLGEGSEKYKYNNSYIINVEDSNDLYSISIVGDKITIIDGETSFVFKRLKNESDIGAFYRFKEKGYYSNNGKTIDYYCEEFNKLYYGDDYVPSEDYSAISDLKDGNNELYEDIDHDIEEYYEKIDNSLEKILPCTSYRCIFEEELYGLSAFECKVARNEIYAKYGLKFKSEELNRYFNSKEWYHPCYDSVDEIESMLNMYEKANIEIIKSYEEEGCPYESYSKSKKRRIVHFMESSYPYEFSVYLEYINEHEGYGTIYVREKNKYGDTASEASITYNFIEDDSRSGILYILNTNKEANVTYNISFEPDNQNKYRYVMNMNYEGMKLNMIESEGVV